MKYDHDLPEELLESVVKNPYIHELYAFGSRSTHSDDELSDFDLTVTTPYPAVAEAYTRKSFIDKFGINAIHTIINSEHEVARSFCLASMSLFHKIDIGFSLPNKTIFFPNSRLLFRNNYVCAVRNKTIKKYMEPNDQHDYLDIMLGSLRYVKHRYRGENWSAYRCYHGFIDQLATCRTDASHRSAYKKLDERGNDEILELFFSGDVRNKDLKYHEFIKNLAKNKQLLPEFSEELLKIWEEYIGE